MHSKTATSYQFYIQSNGSGSGDGTFSSPFTSILEALNSIRTREDDASYLFLFREGEYYFDRSIPISLTFPGNRFRSITFQSCEGEHAVFSGRTEIETLWSSYKEDIFFCNIGKGRAIDAFFLNGKKQILARYPKYRENTVLGGYGADCISPERVSRWKNPAGGYIRALHSREWGGNSYIITGKTSDNQLLYSWVGDNNRGSEMHPEKRMVENIFEELDSPHEWYYNAETGNLYFYPPKDTDLSSAVCSVTTTSEFFRISGQDKEHPVGNISFHGIQFSHTHRTLFTEPYERPLRGDWGMVRKGVLTLENTRNITISQCSFSDIGGNAIVISGYNTGHVIDHNDFTSIGATGVLAMGYPSAVRDPSTYDGQNHRTTIQDYVPGPKSEDYPRDIIISSNYFYDIGTYEKQAAAVCMSISRSITVSRNTIHHTSRAGINVHEGTFGGHIIEYNDLFDCVTETSDHGPINCWGRDRFWTVPQHDAMGYFGKEKRPFALLDACSTTIIRGNRIHADHAFGIDLDDGSSNYDIYDNLCIGVGIKTREGFDRKVHNNLLIGSSFDIHVSYAQNNDLFYTNIVCSSTPYHFIRINEGATTIFTNNMYFNPFGGSIPLPDSDFLSVTGNPLFMDFYGNDFRLKEDSPALKMGFVSFPVSDCDFGRPDKPNPPKYVYLSPDSQEVSHFYDVILSNISGEGIRSAAGLPDCNGVFIVEREALGLFSKLGLSIDSGDVIRAIGNKMVRNVSDFFEAIQNIPLNQAVTIDIFRSQKPLCLEFVNTADDYQFIVSAARKQQETLLSKSEGFTPA